MNDKEYMDDLDEFTEAFKDFIDKYKKHLQEPHKYKEALFYAKKRLFNILIKIYWDFEIKELGIKFDQIKYL